MLFTVYMVQITFHLMDTNSIQTESLSRTVSPLITEDAFAKRFRNGHCPTDFGCSWNDSTLVGIQQRIIILNDISCATLMTILLLPLSLLLLLLLLLVILLPLLLLVLILLLLLIIILKSLSISEL